MKITTDILKVALEWVEKNWLEVEGYNLTMTKVAKPRPPVWAEQLIKDVTVLKEFVVEQKAFNAQVFEFMKRTDARLEKIEQDVAELKKDVALIKSCPTIKKELSELNKIT